MTLRVRKGLLVNSSGSQKEENRKHCIRYGFKYHKNRLKLQDVDKRKVNGAGYGVLYHVIEVKCQ